MKTYDQRIKEAMEADQANLDELAEVNSEYNTIQDRLKVLRQKQSDLKDYQTSKSRELDKVLAEIREETSNASRES